MEDKEKIEACNCGCEFECGCEEFECSECCDCEECSCENCEC